MTTASERDSQYSEEERLAFGGNGSLQRTSSNDDSSSNGTSSANGNTDSAYNSHLEAIDVLRTSLSGDET